MREQGRDPRRKGGSTHGAADAEELAVHSLTTAEALIVWGIRHWVSCLKAKTDPIPLMTAGFGAGDVAAAVRPLEAVLVITLDAATVPLDVRCQHCEMVGDGERAMLAAIAFEQAGRPAQTLEKLREWLPSASARLAQEMIAEIAKIIQIRGLRVPLRREYDAGSLGGNHLDIRVAVPASMSVH